MLDKVSFTQLDDNEYIDSLADGFLDLEATTHCNLKCFMCFQSYDAPKADIMDIKLFKKIIDEGFQKGLCSIKTQYRGERLLYTAMTEMIS